MEEVLTDDNLTFHPSYIPLVSEEVVETSPEVELDDEVAMYEEDLDPAQLILQVIPSNQSIFPHVQRRNNKTESIRDGVSSEEVDITMLGKTVIMGVGDGSLNSSQVDKAVKAGTSVTNYLGDISMEALVNGMMAPDGADARYAMIGSAMMWNVLKSNMRDIRTKITARTSQSQPEPRFECFDLQMSNISKQKRYLVQANGVFVDVDLKYLFTRLVFRSSARLLNKAKKLLKAYFVVACRPRCMIWRYTLRRTGSTHKKAILNLPDDVLNSLLDILLDLTGVGNGQKSYNELNPASQFFQSLGEDSRFREARYMEICQLKDPLINFFRDLITDVLNEIREMPFCCKSGIIVSAPRGKGPAEFCVTWKEYESHLKREYEMPSETNTKMRIAFEQKVCEPIPR